MASFPPFLLLFPPFLLRFLPASSSSSSGITGSMDGLAGCNCTNCGRFVKFKACQSNANGNRGRLIATCHLVNEQGEPCQFFRWAPGSSKSPSTSPSIPSTSTLLPPIAHVTPVSTLPPPIAHVASIAGPTPLRCPIQGCGQTRIADDCLRRVCRKHCVGQGGCASKKHKAAASLSLSHPLPPSNATTTPPPLPSPDPAPSQPQPATMVVHTSNTSSQPLDARPDPRFASHLLPIYVESLAREQTLELSKSKLDAERITSAKQAAQKKGFTWPFVKLSLAILSLIGLQQSAELGALQIYDETDEYWLTIDVDHIIEVREGQHVFLRDRSVINCHGFDELFKQVSHPHLRNNLPQERAYVRNAWKALNLGSSSSSQKRKATSPPPHHHFPSSVKRERSLSTPLQDVFPSSLSLSSTSTPSPTPISTASSNTPMTCTSGGSVDDPIELSDGDEKKWPRDYFVCDVAPCFRDARTYVRGRHPCTAAVIFHEHFPSLDFHSSTFSDNKAIWRKAPQRLKNRYLVIGRKKAGCWSKFTAELKRSETTRPSSPEDFIELSDSS
ncbi:hypothetical protein BYT27DRAFT_7215152 [Phlegmacium glaucopus]|nr:hypothetical protein BYT27DRAFT_7215152 [Phlegmacium glaucopus]